MIAGNNMSVGNHSQINNYGGGDLTLVVDNQEPSPDFFGPGQFNFLSGAFVSPEGGGILRIFTSVQSQNTIESAINGMTFVPGELYVDSNTERWGTYYPNSFSGGEAFTFFYKDSAANPSLGEPGGVPFPRGRASRNQILSLSRQSEVDTVQFFYELSDLNEWSDDLLWWGIDFKLCYDLLQYERATKLPGSLSSYQLNDPCKHLFIKRKKNFSKLPLPPFEESYEDEIKGTSSI